ncbi:MAG: TlpA disulfide reductase family protein [Bacteroidota bacterium]
MLRSPKSGPVLLFLLLLIFVVQYSLMGQSPKNTVISGHVSNHSLYPTDRVIEVAVITPPEDLVYSLTLDENGYFHTNFTYNLPADFYLFYRDFALLIPVEPGDSMFFQVDGAFDQFSSWANHIEVTGKGSDKAALAIQFEGSLWKFEDREKIARQKFISLRANDYLAYADSVRESDLTKANQFIDTKQPGSIMQTWIRQVAEENYFYFMSRYPVFWERKNELKANLPERFYTFHLEFLQDKWTITDWMNGDFWRNYTNYFGYREVTGLIFSRNKGKGIPFPKLDSLVYQRWDSLDHIPDYVAQMHLSRYAIGRLQMMDLSPIEAYNGYLEKRLGNSPFWPRIQQEADKTRSALEAVSPLPAPTFFSLTGVSGESIMDSIVAQHPDKVICLDVWATWCGPCRQQMPYSHKLHQTLQDSAIAFVYVCMQSDSAQYLPIIEHHQLSGSHYFLDSLQGETFAKNCQLRGFPQYLILNKRGEIVNYHAPSPSSEALKPALLKVVRE